MRLKGKSKVTILRPDGVAWTLPVEELSIFELPDSRDPNGPRRFDNIYEGESFSMTVQLEPTAMDVLREFIAKQQQRLDPRPGLVVSVPRFSHYDVALALRMRQHVPVGGDVVDMYSGPGSLMWVESPEDDGDGLIRYTLRRGQDLVRSA